MLSRWLRFAAAWLLCASFGSVPTGAHDLPLDRVMNAFVKIEAHKANMVIRVPLDLLRAVPFPIEEGRYNLAASRPAVEAALSALASDISIWENGVRLVSSSAAGGLAPLSDRSFEDYDRAVAAVAAPLEPGARISYDLGYLDAHFVYAITSPHSVFTIQSLVAGDLQDYVKLTIRYMPLGGASRVMMITSGSGPVALDPAWYQASLGFIELGVVHILSGTDHLLFLLCLIIPFRRVKGLIPVITAFTVGHSVTLIGTAYNFAPVGSWFPPFVETAIAVSILYMALENIVGVDLRRRWIIAGLFGLVHGCGFADALKEQLQFAGSHLLVSLLSFNVGIEIGQLVVLCAFVPALVLLLRGPLSGRMGIIVLSAIIAHTAWHWMVDRGEVLWQTPWPQLTLPVVMTLARWIAGVLLCVGAARLLSKWIERKRGWGVRPAENRADV